MPPIRLMTAALAAALLLASSAPAADWPQWGGTSGKNMASAEAGLPDTFDLGEKDPQGGGVRLETAKNITWAARIGAMTCSSPTVAGGRLFIGTMRNDRGFFLCLDEATGKALWRWDAPCLDVPALIDGRAFKFGTYPKQLGVCSTAAVDGDAVYFVNHRLELMCLGVSGKPRASAPAAVAEAKDAPATPAAKKDAAKKPAAKSEREWWPEAPAEADVRWSFDIYATGVRPSDAVNCSPVVDENYVYVLTANGVDRLADARKHDEERKVPAPDAPNVMVFDKRTGRLVAVDDVRFPERMLHGQWSSPALGKVGGKTHIYFGGGDGLCYAFEAPAAPAATPAPGDKPAILKKVWWADCNPKEYQAAVGDRPLFLHYCLGDKRRADALNKPDKGTFVGMSEIVATPVFHKDRVYVAIGRDPAHGRGRGALWCIDATKTGDVTEAGRVWCYQGLDRSLSTASIADGLVYVADVAGRIHCLDADTGKVFWVHENNTQTWGSTLVADGKVFLGTEKGLWILAAGREYKALGKINIGAPVWATPVAANGVLYVASKTYLYAVQKRP